jgi:O-antigen/teichoic acid export membrane protein
MTTLRARLNLVSLDTLRQGLVLFAATSAVSVLNYLFHVVLSRMLGPAEYATLAAVLSVFATVGAPTGAAQAILADYVARFRALGQQDRISGLCRKVLNWLGVASVPVALAVVLLASPLAAFLRLDSVFPVLALALATLTTLLNPALTGIFQGLQRFRLLGIILLATAVVRLVSGVALSWVGWGAAGGIAASAVAGAVSIGIGLLVLRPILRERGEAPQLPIAELGRYGGSVLVQGFLFSTFLSLDVVLVKHYFEPELAGYYAAAATVGKMVFFLPGAVGTVMFPRVSAQLAAGGSGASVLRKSVLVTVGLCGALTLVLFLVPGLVTQLLFGPAYAPTAALVGGYSLVMVLLAVVNLLMLFHLSAHRSRFMVLLGAGVLLEALGIALWHAQLSHALLWMGASAAAVIVASELWLPALFRWDKV